MSLAEIEPAPPQNEDIIYNAERKELLLTGHHWNTLPPKIVLRYASRTEYLDLTDNRMANFDWIYDFNSLHYLILDCNRLHETHLRRLPKPLPMVKVLTLNKNELSDLTATVLLIGRCFPNLEYLSLHGNPICPDGLEVPFGGYAGYEYDHYRVQIVNALPKLKFLDHASITAPIVTTKPQSQTPRVLKIAPKILWNKLFGVMPTKRPQETAAENHRLGVTMEQASHSTGMHSEGNRYILNQDL